MTVNTFGPDIQDDCGVCGMPFTEKDPHYQDGMCVDCFTAYEDWIADQYEDYWREEYDREHSGKA